jgi:hypothetical protein
MIPIQRDIIEPLRGVIGATLTSVCYRPLQLECSLAEIENADFYIGGELVLEFDNGEKRFFSWAENGDYDCHFTLAVRSTSHFSEGTLETIDASATRLWSDALGERLIGSRCIGWDNSPHVLELDFGRCVKLIGSAWQTSFGDADDLFFCDARGSRHKLEGAMMLWRSTSGEQDSPFKRG